MRHISASCAACLQQVLATLYTKFSPCAIYSYVNSVSANFGFSFTIVLISVYVGVKGLMLSLLHSVQVPYYKSLGLDGAVYQVNSAVASTPWAMKGLIGVLSDCQPIAGYHKKYYMVLASLFGATGILILVLLPHHVAMNFSWIPAVLFFCANAEGATVDLLCEGKYVELMAKLPHTKGDVVTFVWICIGFGSFLATLCVGPLTEYFGPKLIFALALPCAVQVLFPLLTNCLPEEKLPPTQANKFRMDKFMSHAKVFSLALTMAAAAVLVAIVGVVGGVTAKFSATMLVSALLCIMGLLCLPRTLALCNIYLYLCDALYVNVGGALEYFYLADEECLVNGPHFDLIYYYTYVSIIGMVASGVGLWLFQTVLSSWKFRKVFWITSLIRVFASFVDWIIVKRINLSWGITDKWMYLFGHAIILQLCGALNFMPGVILTCRLCPKNMESTVYALLAGYANFGSNVSKLLGVVAMKMASIETQPPCDFSGLPSLLVWCHGILPLLCIPLTFVLIPDAYMDESLTDLDPGSLAATVDRDNEHTAKIAEGRGDGKSGVEAIAVGYPASIDDTDRNQRIARDKDRGTKLAGLPKMRIGPSESEGDRRVYGREHRGGMFHRLDTDSSSGEDLYEVDETMKDDGFTSIELRSPKPSCDDIEKAREHERGRRDALFRDRLRRISGGEVPSGGSKLGTGKRGCREMVMLDKERSGSDSNSSSSEGDSREKGGGTTKERRRDKTQGSVRNEGRIGEGGRDGWREVGEADEVRSPEGASVVSRRASAYSEQSCTSPKHPIV
eukprot:GHVQ01028180.1.p1 GENE.GHVQ01028180.1~~GHVQ01028180.1.p1  ORF type:complete len:788 (-),score=87.61 GHVQ01028180.1:279-2642(-)